LLVQVVDGVSEAAVIEHLAGAVVGEAMTVHDAAITTDHATGVSRPVWLKRIAAGNVTASGCADICGTGRRYLTSLPSVVAAARGCVATLDMTDANPPAQSISVDQLAAMPDEQRTALLQAQDTAALTPMVLALVKAKERHVPRRVGGCDVHHAGTSWRAWGLTISEFIIAGR
jgi:hypothetical protein